jgi:hypothetical protein
VETHSISKDNEKREYNEKNICKNVSRIAQYSKASMSGKQLISPWEATEPGVLIRKGLPDRCGLQ